MFKTKFSYAAVVIATISMFLQVGEAKADVFLYEDPDYNFIFSVPDTWKRQTTVSSLTRIRFDAPVPSDQAFCKVDAEKDARFTVYPKRLMKKVMAENFDSAFWEEEVSRRFINPELFQARTSAGLDKGDATMTQLSYDLVFDDEKTPTRMYATLITTVYGDTRYTMTCSSTYESYSRWSDLFGSIFSSMTLEDRYHPVPTGYYRNFLTDKDLSIRRPRLGNIDK